MDFKIEDERLWHYRAEILKVVDGDTLDLLVDRGFNEYAKVRVRLLGIDTPELRDSDPAMKAKAFAARDRVRELCPVGSEVLIQTRKGDSFGRWLANIWIDGLSSSLTETLIQEGHGIPYRK